MQQSLNKLIRTTIVGAISHLEAYSAVRQQQQQARLLAVLAVARVHGGEEAPAMAQVHMQEEARTGVAHKAEEGWPAQERTLGVDCRQAGEQGRVQSVVGSEGGQSRLGGLLQAPGEVGWGEAGQDRRRAVALGWLDGQGGVQVQVWVVALHAPLPQAKCQQRQPGVAL
jgi:hypothetical protein